MSRQTTLAVLVLVFGAGPGRGWSPLEAHSNASAQHRASPRSPGRHEHTDTAHQDIPTYPLPPPPPPPARSTSAAPDAGALPSPVMQADASSASSRTYLQRALPGPLDALAGTPSSFSYFMQVQPHPRGSAYRQRTRQESRVVNLVPHGGGRGREQLGPAPAAHRAPFSGDTFQSFPFGPIQVPSTFTHPNPLAGHYRRPPAPAGAADDYAADAPPVGFMKAASYLGGRPQEGVGGAPRPSAPRRRRPKAKQQTKPLDITVLGDPRRPNLGIVGVPGQDVYEPAPPRIREYDPYTGRFKVLTPEEAHDSREEYRRPGASGETSAETGDAHQPAEAGDALREEESYEVYETPEETHALVPMRAPRGRASGCLQKDFLTGLLSPLIDAIRPAIKQCQKQQRQQPPQQQFGRLHRPRGRPRKKPARQSKQRLQQAQQAQHEAREPYFEFRNPVHNYISGEPQGRGLGLGLEDLADGDADAEYLSLGEAERESRAEPQHREELFTEDDKSGDDGVFAPYSVYRTVLEPDRKFRPFVRFPFEAERSDLKAMVNDLIHQGTAPP